MNLTLAAVTRRSVSLISSLIHVRVPTCITGYHQALSSPDTVKAGLTPKRPRQQVENDEYAAFVRRILRAYSRRVGDGDVEALALMLGLAGEIDTAIAEAVKGLRACGYSWA